MKNKKIMGIAVAAVLVAAVAVITFIAINSGLSNEPQTPLNNMVKALNALDFNGYVNTLHPALRADAKKGMESGNESSYMHTLRTEMLSQYESGSKIHITTIASYPLEPDEIVELKQSYKAQGYDLNIDDAMIFYYYSILLPNGTPDAPDDAIVVKSGNTWYILG